MTVGTICDLCTLVGIPHWWRVLAANPAALDHLPYVALVGEDRRPMVLCGGNGIPIDILDPPPHSLPGDSWHQPG